MKALKLCAMVTAESMASALAAVEPQPVHWLRMPTGDDMGANWPSDRSVEGRVLMQCMVKPEGKLEGCSILQNFRRERDLEAPLYGSAASSCPPR